VIAFPDHVALPLAAAAALQAAYSSFCGLQRSISVEQRRGIAAGRMGYYGHSELGGGTLLKKIVFVMLLLVLGVGAFFAWKMLKGDGGCCGWGGDNTDPWSSYTPPAEETETPAA
jgi:hypothetical protein